jgi:hypothetical protein
VGHYRLLALEHDGRLRWLAKQADLATSRSNSGLQLSKLQHPPICIKLHKRQSCINNHRANPPISRPISGLPDSLVQQSIVAACHFKSPLRPGRAFANMMSWWSSSANTALDEQIEKATSSSL